MVNITRANDTMACVLHLRATTAVHHQHLGTTTASAVTPIQWWDSTQSVFAESDNQTVWYAGLLQFHGSDDCCS